MNLRELIDHVVGGDVVTDRELDLEVGGVPVQGTVKTNRRIEDGS